MLVFTFAGCGGGGGNNGGTVSGQIADSNIFVAGRTVTIRDLYVCNHEVTQKEFGTYMKLYYAGRNDFGYQGYSGTGDNYPVFWTSWYSALIYCNLRSKAEGLTPCYYIEINGQNETDIDKWITIVPEYDPQNAPGQKRLVKDEEKYYWKGAEAGNGAFCSVLDYEGNSDPDGGIQFNKNANGYRLPTEVEWEYIAREGNNGIPNTQYTYSGSDTYTEVAVCGNEYDGLV